MEHEKFSNFIMVIQMEFFLFTTDLQLAMKAEDAGIDSVIVDWESKEKIERQEGSNFETNLDTPQDVVRLSSNLKIPVTVRINSLSKTTQSEIDCALVSGAKIIMLPMAQSVDDVKIFLNYIGNRAKTIVQIETPSLVKQVCELKNLPWDYIYLGLNDLMIARGQHSIWEAVIDGTVEQLCTALKGRSYGFGGSTIVGGGDPIPQVLLLNELVRLGGSLSFMRRTFKKELLDRDLKFEMNALRAFVNASQGRGSQAIVRDHKAFLRKIAESIESSRRT
jgi:hypothetical protein